MIKELEITVTPQAITLDARAMILSGGEPYHLVLAQLIHRQKEQKLVFITPFEPHPMMAQMRLMGYDPVAVRVDQDYWETVVTPRASTGSTA